MTEVSRLVRVLDLDGVTDKAGFMDRCARDLRAAGLVRPQLGRARRLPDRPVLVPRRTRRGAGRGLAGLRWRRPRTASAALRRATWRPHRDRIVRLRGRPELVLAATADTAARLSSSVEE